MRVMLALLAAATWVNAQSVTLPKEIKAEPREWVFVVPEVKDGGKPKWRVSKGLVEVPLDKLFPNAGEQAGKVFKADKPGVYRVEVWNAKGDVPSNIACCRILIGQPDPKPPEPGPNPPTPPTPPTPDNPAPIPDAGYRVLILYESADTLPAQQSSILTAAPIRDYFDANCIKGPDGKTPEARIWDWDVDTSSVSDLWRKAVEKAKTKADGKAPLILISNGKTGTIEPLPANVAATLELLKKWRGN